MDLQLIYQSEYFTCYPCRDCDVPGYLVLLSNLHVSHFDDTPMGQRAELGLIIGKLERAILTVLAPERVYVLRFSEALGDVHFHIFPRSGHLADLFHRTKASATSDINGPLLFAWARKRFAVQGPDHLSDATLNTAKRIRAALT